MRIGANSTLYLLYVNTLWLLFLKSTVNINVSGTPFETVYKQYCREVQPLTTPSVNSLEVDTSTDRQQDNNQLYCGYCNEQCKTPVGLEEHCKMDSHKYAVFADSGRDVLWQFEPPLVKKQKISAAIYG